MKRTQLCPPPTLARNAATALLLGLLAGCGGGSSESAPKTATAAVTPADEASAAISSTDAVNAADAASEAASDAASAASAPISVRSSPSARSRSSVKADSSTAQATGSNAAAIPQESGSDSSTGSGTGNTVAGESVLGTPVDSSTEAGPNVKARAVTAAPLAGCKVNEQRSFAACRAHASLGLSHGESVSFSNLKEGYTGNVTASCNNGKISWTQGICTSTTQSLAAKSANSSASLAAPPDLSSTNVFVANPPYAVVTRFGVKSVTLAPYPSKSQVARAHDFVDRFIDSTTLRPNALSLQSAYPDGSSIVHRNLYENSTPVLNGKGIPNRIEKTKEGLRIAYLPNDPPSSDKLRTQINSYAIPTRTKLTWDLSLQFGGNTAAEAWPIRPFTTSPVLIWQVIQFSSGFPPMGIIADTDPADSGKIFLTFFQRTSNTSSYSHRWTVNGLARGQFHDIVVQATLDDRDATEGGIGQLRVWVNGVLLAQRDGRNLMTDVNDVHRWAFGVYQTNEPKAVNFNRTTIWRRARMLVDK